MSCRLLRLAGLIALVAALMAPGLAAAHPLGNFSVNRFMRLEPAGDGVHLTYVLDMAEIPAFQEQSRIDLDRDGQLDAGELDTYSTARAEELGRGVRLELNAVPTSPRLIDRVLSFPPGQGGLTTLRLEARFLAELPPGASGPISLRYRDENEAGRLGWREIIARPGGPGTEIQRTSVPATDQSDELRSYPDDLLSSPLDVREAQITFVPGTVAAAPASGVRSALARPKDAFAELIAPGELTPSIVIFSLFAALVLGALHALSPGHGKTVVAAYLIGARGTARHAVFLGATVTATHTIGVYALGVVTLYLSEYIVPERLYPVLQIVSGLLVVGIGAWLFVTRLQGALLARRSAAQHSDAHAHRHPQTHQHDAHQHGEAESHEHGHSHHYVHGHGSTAPRSFRPSFGHGHAHGHDHDHDHAEGGLVHSHGGRSHTHLPPGADGRPVTMRSLLALGVSGGLVPCPSALVVLLSAIALQRVAFGLLLIVAFSIGLAAVLVGIGLVLVYARHLFQRVSFGGGFAPRLVPVATALLIVATGVALVLQALPLA